jgi:hypothetical protein
MDPDPRSAGKSLRRGGVALGAAAGVVGVAIAVLLVGASAGLPGMFDPQSQIVPRTVPCPASASIQFAGTPYVSCDASLNWSGVGLWPAPMQTPDTNVSLDGVAFAVFGYATEDCAVVNVTGAVAGGPADSFLIYPTPDGCDLLHPTAFAPDGAFGASWDGNSVVVLLVRAAA